VWIREGQIISTIRPTCRKRRLLGYQLHLAGSLFAVSCNPWGGMKEVISFSKPWRLACGLSPCLWRPLVEPDGEGGLRDWWILYITMTPPLPSSSKLQSKETNVRKRQATESIHVSEDNSDESFPHFLVVETTDSTPVKHSIFKIQKILQCAVGNAKSTKNYGAVIVEVTSKSMAKWALSMRTWVDTEIKVSPHRSLNSSRGVIRCCDFRDCDDLQVMDALRSQGFIDVKHIKAKKDNILQPTNTFILTFSCLSPPKSIKAATEVYQSRLHAYTCWIVRA